MSVGMWNYKDIMEPCQYGEEVTYKKLADFLDGCETVEDWGCGTGYAKKFFSKSRYVGVDGSWSRFADVEADLRLYRSSPDGLMLRHVLEHNYDWPLILENAVASFRRKMAIAFFMPLERFTRLDFAEANGVPNLILGREGILKILSGLSVVEELVTGLEHTWPYHSETVFYITRPEAVK